jgi:WD40 repeat protein
MRGTYPLSYAGQMAGGPWRRRAERSVTSYDAFLSYSHADESHVVEVLQHALRVIGKPWYRRQALRVFRDQTNLSANPQLWSSISETLDRSEWFVLLASPAAATSPWVDREVAYWLEHRDSSRLLVVVTGGEWVWDDAAGDFDRSRSTATPPSLFGAFSEEPRHIDLRWAHDEDNISARTPRLRDHAAEIAAPIHHLSKEDLVGDDLRQHRRTVRTARAAVAVLVLLMLTASVAAVNASRNADRARDSEARAEARELAAAATANIDVDPERSVLLALAAVERSSGQDGGALPEAEEALHRAVTASRIAWRVPDSAVLDWSPQGETFAALQPFEDDPGLVDIRDARTGDPVLTLDVDAEGAGEGAYNHDGSLLATTGLDGALRVWDPATGDQVQAVEGSADEPAQAPSFSPDGSTVAAAWPYEGVTRVVEVATGRTVREIRSVPAPLGTSFSPSGDRIAIASALTANAHVFNVHTGVELVTLKGHVNQVVDVAWSPDGLSIATSGVDGSARIWDARTGAQRFALLGHEAVVNNVDWSPDSTHLATASGDGTAKVWLLTEGGPRQLFTLSAHDMRNGVWEVAFSPNGSWLMTGDVGANATQVWDVSIGGDAEVANLPGVGSHYGSAAYTPDGRSVVSSSLEDSVTVWDPKAVRAVRTLGGGPTPEVEGVFEPTVGSRPEVGTVAVSADGGAVAAVTYVDGSVLRIYGNDVVRVWDLATGDTVFSLEPGGEIVGVDWSPDSELLALAISEPGQRDRILIVDRNGDEVAELQAEPPVVFTEIAFTADGRHLVVPRESLEFTDTDTRGVDLWDWRRAEVVDTIETPPGYSTASPTGSHVAVFPYGPSGNDANLELWDVSAGRRVATLPGGAGNIAFGPDGTIAVTGADDGIVRVWDVETGTERVALRGHTGAISDVSVSPDGAHAMSVGADGTVRVWALRLDDLVAIAEDGLTRTLTNAECRRYLHADRCEPASSDGRP